MGGSSKINSNSSSRKTPGSDVSKSLLPTHIKNSARDIKKLKNDLGWYQWLPKKLNDFFVKSSIIKDFQKALTSIATQQLAGAAEDNEINACLEDLNNLLNTPQIDTLSPELKTKLAEAVENKLTAMMRNPNNRQDKHYQVMSLLFNTLGALDANQADALETEIIELFSERNAAAAKALAENKEIANEAEQKPASNSEQKLNAKAKNKSPWNYQKRSQQTNATPLKKYTNPWKKPNRTQNNDAPQISKNPLVNAELVYFKTATTEVAINVNDPNVPQFVTLEDLHNQKNQETVLPQQNLENPALPQLKVTQEEDQILTQLKKITVPNPSGFTAPSAEINIEPAAIKSKSPTPEQAEVIASKQGLQDLQKNDKQAQSHVDKPVEEPVPLQSTVDEKKTSKPEIQAAVPASIEPQVSEQERKELEQLFLMNQNKDKYQEHLKNISGFKGIGGKNESVQFDASIKSIILDSLALWKLVKDTIIAEIKNSTGFAKTLKEEAAQIALDILFAYLLAKKANQTPLEFQENDKDKLINLTKSLDIYQKQTNYNTKRELYPNVLESIYQSTRNGLISAQSTTVKANDNQPPKTAKPTNPFTKFTLEKKYPVLEQVVKKPESSDERLANLQIYASVMHNIAQDNKIADPELQKLRIQIGDAEQVVREKKAALALAQENSTAPNVVSARKKFHDNVSDINGINQHLRDYPDTDSRWNQKVPPYKVAREKMQALWNSQQDQLATLEDKQTQLTTQRTAIQQQFISLQQAISVNKVALNQATGNIGEVTRLNALLEPQKKELSELETQINTLQSQLRTIQKELKTLNEIKSRLDADPKSNEVVWHPELLDSLTETEKVSRGDLVADSARKNKVRSALEDTFSKAKINANDTNTQAAKQALQAAEQALQTVRAAYDKKYQELNIDSNAENTLRDLGKDIIEQTKELLKTELKLEQQNQLLHTLYLAGQMGVNAQSIAENFLGKEKLKLDINKLSELSPNDQFKTFCVIALLAGHQNRGLVNNFGHMEQQLDEILLSKKGCIQCEVPPNHPIQNPARVLIANYLKHVFDTVSNKTNASNLVHTQMRLPENVSLNDQYQRQAQDHFTCYGISKWFEVYAINKASSKGKATDLYVQAPAEQAALFTELNTQYQDNQNSISLSEDQTYQLFHLLFIKKSIDSRLQPFFGIRIAGSSDAQKLGTFFNVLQNQASDKVKNIEAILSELLANQEEIENQELNIQQALNANSIGISQQIYFENLATMAPTIPNGNVIAPQIQTIFNSQDNNDAQIKIGDRTLAISAAQKKSLQKNGGVIYINDGEAAKRGVYLITPHHYDKNGKIQTSKNIVHKIATSQSDPWQLSYLYHLFGIDTNAKEFEANNSTVLTNANLKFCINQDADVNTSDLFVINTERAATASVDKKAEAGEDIGMIGFIYKGSTQFAGKWNEDTKKAVVQYGKGVAEAFIKA